MRFWKQLIYNSVTLAQHPVQYKDNINLPLLSLPLERPLHPSHHSHLASSTLPISVLSQTVENEGNIIYFLSVQIITDNFDICNSILCFGCTSDHEFVILICNKRERVFRMAGDTERDNVVIVGKVGWFEDTGNFDEELSFKHVKWDVATKVEKG